MLGANIAATRATIPTLGMRQKNVSESRRSCASWNEMSQEFSLAKTAVRSMSAFWYSSLSFSSSGRICSARAEDGDGYESGRGGGTSERASEASGRREGGRWRHSRVPRANKATAREGGYSRARQLLPAAPPGCSARKREVVGVGYWRPLSGSPSSALRSIRLRAPFVRALASLRARTHLVVRLF